MIAIQTLEAAGRDEIAHKLIDAVQTAISSQLVLKSSPGDLAAGESRMLTNAGGKWCGRVQIQVKDQAAIQDVFKKIHASAVEVDGSSHVIEVLSDFVKDPKLGGV